MIWQVFIVYDISSTSAFQFPIVYTTNTLKLRAMNKIYVPTSTGAQNNNCEQNLTPSHWI